MFANIQRLSLALLSAAGLSKLDAAARYTDFKSGLHQRCGELTDVLNQEKNRRLVEHWKAQLDGIARAESDYAALWHGSGSAQSLQASVKTYAGCVRAATEAATELRRLINPYRKDIAGITRAMRFVAPRLSAADVDLAADLAATTNGITVLLRQARETTSPVASRAALKLFCLEDQGITLVDRHRDEAYERAALVYLGGKFC